MGSRFATGVSVRVRRSAFQRRARIIPGKAPNMEVSESTQELRRIAKKIESCERHFDFVRRVCEAGIVLWRLVVAGNLGISQLFDLTEKQSSDFGDILQRLVRVEEDGNLDHRHPEEDGFTVKQYFCGVLMEFLTFRVLLIKEHLPNAPGQRIRCKTTAGPRPEMEKLREERKKIDPIYVVDNGLFLDPPVGQHDGEYVNLHSAESDTYARACRVLAQRVETLNGSTNDSGHPASKGEEASSPRSKTTTMSHLKTMTGLKNTALNRYMDKAGVTKPERGKKNHRFTNDELQQILQAIVNNSTEQSTIKRAQDALDACEIIPS